MATRWPASCSSPRTWGCRTEETKTPKVEEFFVDLGLPAEIVRAAVTPGDAVTMHRTLERVGDRVSDLGDVAATADLLEAFLATLTHEALTADGP